MKKQIKILGLMFMGLFTFVTSFADAELVDKQTHTSLVTNCDGGTFQTVVYAGSNGHQMTDTFTNTNTSYVWIFNMQGKNENGSYYSLYNVIPNALSMPSMPWLSNGKPHNVNTVVAMGYKDGGASVTSTIPSTYRRSDIAAQVVYHLSRTHWVYKEGGKSKLSYLDYNNLGALTQEYTYGVNILKGAETVSDNECMNIYIGFCGDGIVDNGTAKSSTNINTPLKGGEECDDGSANGTSSSNCTSSCKLKPDKAVCGTADKTTRETAPSTTAEKCADGTSSTVSTDTTNKKWTWKCTKGNDEKSCEAYMDEPACGTANGTTRETAPSTNAEKCADGTSTSVTEKDGKFSWKCKKSGLEVSCNATKKEPDKAVCGTADKTTRETAPSTTAEKCSDGTSSTVSTDTTNKKWTWKCTKGNDEKSCEAYMDEPACGTANGTTRETAPSTNAEKCADGTSTSVTEKDGKFSWKCKKSGLEVSCSATKKEPDKAVCGTADKTTRETAPSTTAEKCSDGTSSTVSTDTTNKKWTWKCTKGNDEKSCEAYMDEPACGTANGTTRETAPSTNAEKCADGTSTSVTEKDGKFSWKCKKSGLEVSCNATKKEPDKAVCGTADKTTRETAPSTTAEKCSDGTSSTVSTDTTNKKWTWKCTKGNDEKSCEAYMDEPACGTANGTTRETAPSTNAEKCADGTSTSVTEKDGKFSWKCKKSGLEVSCSATKKEPDKAVCGTADKTTRETAPSTTAEKCSDGTSSTVSTDTTNKKWTWKCTKGNDEKSCEAYMDEPACGTANGTTRETAPSTNAEKCADGTSTSVTEKDGKFSWKCKKSGLEVSCSATKKEPDKAVCGTADKTTRETAPSTTAEKCSDGTSSTVSTDTTNKKWTWKCTKGNDEKSCEAYMDEPACGTANGTTRETAPSTNAEKCADGTSTSVTEEDGKFSWKCKKSGLEVSCSATKKEELPYVEIEKKELLGKTKYKVGDKVSFKVYFKNNTSKDISNALIRDFFPLNLKFPLNLDSSNVYISAKSAKIGQYIRENNHIIEFSGFSLKAGESGYIILTGEVTDDYMSNTYNCAFSYKKAGETAVTFKCSDPYNIDKDLYIEKNVVKVGDKVVTNSNSKEVKVSNGEEIVYEIKIISYGGINSGLVIRDDLPSGVTYVDKSYSVSGPEGIVLEKFKKGDPLFWTIKIPNFKKGKEIIIKYSVRVNQDSQEASYKNEACALDLSDSELGCATHIINKDAGGLKVNKYVSKSSNGDWKNSLTLNASDENPIIYFKIEVVGDSGKLKEFIVTDDYDLDTFEFVKLPGTDKYYIDAIPDTIKRDESYDFSSSMKFENGQIAWNVKMNEGSFSKGNVYYIIFPMKIKTTSGSNIACVVNPSVCSDPPATFKVEPDPIPDCIQEKTCPEPVCGDGIQEGFEVCDWGDEAPHVIGKDGKLFKEKGIYNSAYSGLTCSSDCHLNLDPSCFNVQNGSISIMTGEMLPFYWNVEGMLGTQNEDARKRYLQRNFYSSKSGGGCNEDNVYKIDLDTLKCSFLVYGPSVGGELNKDIIYELNGLDCVGVNGWGDGNDDGTNYYPAIKHYIEQNWNGWFAGSIGSFDGSDEVKNVFKTLNNWTDYPTLFPISSKVIINDFGNKGGSFVLGVGKNIQPRHEINTFGEYKISLDKISYSYCNFKQTDEGKNQFYMTDGINDRVCEVNFAVTNHYLVQKGPLGYVDHETATKLNKYYLKSGEALFTLEDGDEKVANYQMMSNISGNFDTFISKYSRNAKLVSDLNLRQVPGKKIYLTDLDSGKVFDLPEKLLSSGAPFTLIATNGADIRIKGNAVQNMMIITQGRIIFDAVDACNAQENGDSKYSKAGQLVQGIFYAGAGYDSVNDKLNTSVHNDYWCNYGNIHIKGVVLGDLTNVKNKRRSELYTWFRSHDKKREIVLNGASVMVQFNSDLLSSNIPGVDEFSKLLVTQRE